MRDFLCFAVLLASTTAPRVLAQSEPVFPGSLSSSGAFGARDGRLGDLNGDGKLDLLVRNDSTGPELSVALGDGLGGFSPFAQYSDADTLSDVCIARLDSDADLDVVATAITGNKLHLRFNDGNGAMTSFADIPLGAQPAGVDAGDLDSDGDVDLVVAAGDDVLAFLGDGTGAFATPIVWAPGSQLAKLTLADLDADGRLDLIGTVATANTVFVALGDGLGGFGARTDFGATAPCRAVAGDLDGNGTLDVLAGRTILLGDGLGGFTSGGSLGSGALVTALALGDLQSDGQPDVVAATVTGLAQVYVRQGGVYVLSVALHAPSSTQGVVLGGLDGDARLDLIAFQPADPGIVTWIGTADARFGVWHRALSSDAWDLGVADFDRDGRNDVVVSRHADDGLETYLGDGAGGCAPTPVVSPFTDPSRIAVGEFVKDGGNPDVAVSRSNGELAILRWSGPAGLAAVATGATGPWLSSMTASDLDLDGIDELLLTEGGSSIGSLAAPIQVVWGDGSGSLPTPSTLFGPGNATHVAAGDLDGDGAPELVGCLVTGQIVLLRNDGHGQFLAPMLLPSAAHYAYAAAIGDVSGDGRPDVVTANESVLELFAGDGNGNLAAWTTIPMSAGDPVRAVRVADVDADGLGDIVAGCVSQTQLWLSNGSGGFESQGSIDSAVLGGRFVLADFDLDGVRDIASVQGPSGFFGNLRVAHAFRSPQCGQTSYCTAKVNSLGCAPAIGFAGAPSTLAGFGFDVFVHGLRNQKSSLLFYGVNGDAALPLQGGLLCVRPPIARTPVRSSGGSASPLADCSGIAILDVNAYLATGAGLPALHVAGTTVHCQWWSRDPGFSPPNNTSLSNALAFTLCH